MKQSKKVKEIRKKLIISQEELAKILDVSFATVNRWENGHCEPSIQAMRKLKQICVENKIKWED